MANVSQRTIKISGNAYRALSHLSKKEKTPMGDLASAMIIAALTNLNGQNANSHGEQYDPVTGKRIFRR